MHCPLTPTSTGLSPPDLTHSFASKYGLTLTQLIQIYDRNLLKASLETLSRSLFRFRRTNRRTRTGRSGLFAFSSKKFTQSSLPPLLSPPSLPKRSRRKVKRSKMLPPFVQIKSKRLKTLLPGLERIRRRFVLATPFFELDRNREQKQCDQIAVRMKKMYACRVLFDSIRKYLFVPVVGPAVRTWRREVRFFLSLFFLCKQHTFKISTGKTSNV